VLVGQRRSAQIVAVARDYVPSCRRA
jgi:hypothetical protein